SGRPSADCGVSPMSGSCFSAAPATRPCRQTAAAPNCGRSSNRKCARAAARSHDRLASTIGASGGRQSPGTPTQRALHPEAGAMSSHEGFLQAILDDPEDDARRLVYADWLDENGDPERAELIRVQCELARGVEDGERLVALKTRERALCRANGERWLGPLWSDIITRVERGTACLLLTLSEFHSKKVQKAAPEWFVRGGVQELSLHGPSRLLSAAAASPLLARLHTLSLVCATVHDENAKQLAASPHVSNLRSL